MIPKTPKTMAKFKQEQLFRFLFCLFGHWSCMQSCIAYVLRSCNLSPYLIHTYSKADFADPQNMMSNPKSFRRASGKIGLGKKIISCKYSSMAPTLIGTEDGYTIHPDAEKSKLFRPTRSKAVVDGLWTGGASKIFASVHQQKCLGAQVSRSPIIFLDLVLSK
jgi:hypothetical protein